MHLSEGGGRGNVLLRQGMWRVIPETGQVSLSEQTLSTLVNTDPMEKWYILDPEPIARGQFAVVYHCRHRVTGEEFAAKFACRRRLGVDATPDIVHEITVNAILATCSRNVKLQDVFTTETAFILIMEYAPGGDLQTLLDQNLVPYERDVTGFLRQLLDGLVFIHDRNLVHLDIKPQNLVLMGDFPDCAIKLCDFEISRLLTPGYEVREILGTPDYVAPEILHYEPITTRTDMWSFGVLTYVLLTGFLPFGGDNDQETFMQISRGDLDFPNELFEDITPEAIDFMKKLLIRTPERRMSARECLSHPWMKNNVTRPATPSTLDLPSPITTPAPVIRADSSPSVIITTPVAIITTPVATEETESSSEQTPTNNDKEVPSTPVTEEVTPDAAQVVGRPPLHPRSSLKSMSVNGDAPLNTPLQGVTPLPATTPFLNKESRMGSKQNLTRLRSISKSREVLSERIQIANLKKTLSKSRERLYDARLGMSTSREDLMTYKSLSQSVEALTALSQLHQNGALYKSCNNIFIPTVNPVIKEANMPDRMYKSMAAIDKIAGNDLSKKMGYFESRFTVDDDYNDLITRRNTSLNMVISDTGSEATMRLMGGEEARIGGLRGNTCRGGRGAEGCDRVCTRHNHKQSEAQSTQKINKMSRSDRMKKDAQRRRKERKEREQREKERHRRTSLGNHDHLRTNNHEKVTNDGSCSPTFRRGSVCHVEQRLQERHERLLERQEREGRKINMNRTRRLSSNDSDKSLASDRTKSSTSKSGHLSVNEDRSRSITPTRRRKAESPRESDVSQASSMESVTGSLENIQHRLPEQRRKSKMSTVVRPVINITNETKENKNNDVNDNVMKVAGSKSKNTNKMETHKDQDEAYISLEEGSKDSYLLAEKSDDSDSVESDKTYTGSIDDGQSTPTEIIKPITVSSTYKTSTYESDKTYTGSIDDGQSTPTEVIKPITVSSTYEISSPKNEDIVSEVNTLSAVTANKYKTANLTSMEVPESSPVKENCENQKYTRSVSTTSDLGSTISEESEENIDQFHFDVENTKTPDIKSRTRSFSVQHKTGYLVVSQVRTRSNSLHQSPQDTAPRTPTSSQDKARPWGDVCSGSIAKALKNFTMQEEVNTKPNSAEGSK